MIPIACSHWKAAFVRAVALGAFLCLLVASAFPAPLFVCETASGSASAQAAVDYKDIFGLFELDYDAELK